MVEVKIKVKFFVVDFLHGDWLFETWRILDGWWDLWDIGVDWRFFNCLEIYISWWKRGGQDYF